MILEAHFRNRTPVVQVENSDRGALLAIARSVDWNAENRMDVLGNLSLSGGQTKSWFLGLHRVEHNSFVVQQR